MFIYPEKWPSNPWKPCKPIKDYDSDYDTWPWLIPNFKKQHVFIKEPIYTIVSNTTNCVIKVNLPGLNKKTISIVSNNTNLFIYRNSDNFKLCSISIDKKYNINKLKASMEDGLLIISIPYYENNQDCKSHIIE